MSRPVLLLAGLGHAHLFVLEAAWQGRLPPCELVVCTGDARHLYSGMVPGWLAGQYEPDELSLDVAALCAKAGARWVPRHVVGLDAAGRRVRLDDGESMRYDICSVAVGSVASVTSVSGAVAHAALLKPLSGVQRVIDRLASPQLRHVVVVGGGLAGVEVALGVRARLSLELSGRAAGDASAGGAQTSVTLVSASAALAPEREARLSARLAAAAGRQGVTLALGTPVVEVRDDAVALGDGRVLPSDLTIWAGGPSAPAWLAECGVPVDARGCLLVDDALCVSGRGADGAGTHDLFAAGDCATPARAPGSPKSGVHAVRMGPVLARSLAAALRGEAPSPAYRPQRSALALVNSGDGRAVASWRGLTAEGRWVMRWKDRLDRRFVERFAGPG